MTDSESTRLLAWNRELAAAHQRLREALRVARESLGDESVRADLTLYCTGFCAALNGHHTGEDAALFPELTARHPELGATVAQLRQDHDAIAALLARFDAAVTADDGPDELRSHLDGLAAIMESHFRFEERALGDALSSLVLDADPATLLGPL